MKKFFLLASYVYLISSTGFLFGQNSFSTPSMVAKAVFCDTTAPLKEMAVIKPVKGENDIDEIPNKTGREPFNHPPPQAFRYSEDPVWQKKAGIYSPYMTAPIQNFEGINNISGFYPPDTQGDVGQGHYIQVVNMNFAIWNKTGTLLYGPAALKTIWQGIPAPWNNTNNGDPVVLFDQAANRWLISQFSLPNTTQYAELVAISQTSDPAGAWYRYVFQFGNKMPDYPKFGIWPDGYYLSCNQFVSGNSWGGVGACALERSLMLNGDPNARMVYFDLGPYSEPASMLPSDWDGTIQPLTNEPNYFVYFDDWSSSTDYFLKIWQFHVDWTNTSNSTFSEVYSLLTAPFNSTICPAYRGRCIPQPGTTIKLESLSERFMYRLQYRNFATHRSMVTNHTVNVDGNGRAGIRWYELRNTGSGWSIYQQGTFSPDASNRWMGSVAMNSNGDIALGYSVSNSSDIYPSIRYTGRFAGDTIGEMTFGEQTIVTGTGNQTGPACRWGDYSMMSVDPADDLTFWYTNEYIQTSGSVNWKTRIASFYFDPVAPTANFTANPVIPCLNNTVNFTDQSFGNPTSWLWTITPANFTFVEGTTNTSRHPRVKFNKYGTYTVSLTATNPVGSNTKTKTNYISVNTGNAEFTASLTTVVAGSSTKFTDASTCIAGSWSWNFGAGATPGTASTAGPHTVTYSTTGAKTVSLTVNGNSTKTKTNYINVISSPFLMSNGTVHICSGDFYDPGGTSNYADNQNLIMTFIPVSANSKVHFDFNVFSLEYHPNCQYDYLRIYNGPDLSYPLTGTYCGTSIPNSVEANNSYGALTFKFYSDGSVTSTGWQATITCVPNTFPPAAEFNVSNTIIPVGSTAIFSDLSTGAPTTWLWSFTPNSVIYVEGASASSQHPKVQFTGNGIYTVSLTATNSNGADTETKNNYIFAGTAGLWSGNTSSDWNTSSNWHNYIVPSSTATVTLPVSAPHWPNLAGAMALGNQCMNLILDGNSEMITNADFTINPGSSLTFNGSGTLKIGGDWNNYGELDHGAGNIEFIGSTPAKIKGGINRRSYVSNYRISTLARELTFLTGGIAGPTGDDASQDVAIGFNFNYLGIDYTQARINTNGWISLNLTGAADAVDNADLFGTMLPGTVITPWWDDLKADATSSISYKAEGTAPDHVFIVEWKKMITYYQTGTTARISFQLKLYETTNNIEFCYGDAEAGTHDLSESASIGIKDAAGGSGHFKEATTGSSIAGVTNLKSTLNWPVVNYRFTSPAINEVFYKIIENKTNATLTIEPDIVVEGDLILK